MKKIKTFFEKNPGYTRASVKNIVKYSKCAESTVRNFKKSADFKTIKEAHLATAKSKEIIPAQA